MANGHPTVVEARRWGAAPKLVGGARIRECREELGIKPNDFAKRVTISRAQLSEIERGNQELPAHRRAAFAAALQMTEPELIALLTS